MVKHLLRSAALGALLFAAPAFAQPVPGGAISFGQPYGVPQAGADGKLAYNGLTLPVTQRAPSLTDDSAHGYSVGDLWNAPASLYVNVSNTTNAAAWTPVTTGGGPADAVGGVAPLWACGTQRQVAAYATGSAVDVQYASAGTVYAVAFRPDGTLDYDTLDADTAANAFAQPRVVGCYDQTGGGNKATAAFATSPVISPLTTIGTARPIVFDQIQGGASYEFLTIPAAVTAPSNVNSFVMFGRQDNQSNLAGYFQLANATYNMSLIFTNNYNNQSNGLNFYFGAYKTGSPQLVPSTTADILGWSSSVSGLSVYSGGASFSASGQPTFTMAGGTIGQVTAPSTQTAQLEFTGTAIWGRGLSATEVGAFRAASVRRNGSTPQVRSVYTDDGDSITQGVNSALAQGRLRQIEALVAQPMQFFNTGYSGLTAATKAIVFADNVQPTYNAAAHIDLLVEFAGTNDLAQNATAATAYTALSSIVSAWHALGGNAKVCLGETLPRGAGFSNGATAGSFETQRQALIALIDANTAGADCIVPFAHDAAMGAAGAFNTAALYNSTDLTHPTNLGYSRLAGDEAAAVLPLLRN